MRVPFLFFFFVLCSQLVSSYEPIAVKLNGEECDFSSQCRTGICLPADASGPLVGPGVDPTQQTRKICVESLTWGQRLTMGGTANQYYNLRATWLGFGWETLSVIILFITAFFFAILYIIYGLIPTPTLKTFIISNFYHLLASAILVVFLFVFSLFFSQILSFMFIRPIYEAAGVTFDRSSNPSPYGLSYYFLNSMLGCMRNYYNTLYRWQFALSFVTHWSVTKEGVETYPIFWYLASITSLIQVLLNNIHFVIGACFFIRNLLFFIDVTMMPIFVPLGLILRIFPISRGFGNVLIAMGVGFYFVFPLSFSLLIPLVASDLNLKPNSCIGKAAPELLCNDVSSVISTKNEIDRNMNWLNRYIAQAQNDLSAAYYVSLYFFLIAFAITVSFIRSFSLLLGAQIAEIGRGLIRLL